MSPGVYDERQRAADEVRKGEMVRKATMFEIPRGTRPANCPNCGSVVYLLLTEGGKPCAIDPHVKGGSDPTELTSGWGKSHLVRCDVVADGRSSGRRRGTFSQTLV